MREPLRVSVTLQGFYGRLQTVDESYNEANSVVGIGDWFGALAACGQIIVNLYCNLIGAGVRFNWIDPNTELSNDNSFEVEGLAWFIQPPALTLRYAWLKQQASR